MGLHCSQNVWRQLDARIGFRGSGRERNVMTRIQTWEKNVWFVSNNGLCRQYIFIPLAANWVGCCREHRGVYSEGRDLFLCELSKNFSLSTESIALQHLILGRMTHCHSLKDAYCQLIQPNRKCAVLSTVRAFLGKKKKKYLAHRKQHIWCFWQQKLC